MSGVEQAHREFILAVLGSEDGRALVRKVAAEMIAAVQKPLAPDDWLSVAEAAELRGVTVAAMHKAVQRGTIPATKAGRSIRIRRGDCR